MCYVRVLVACCIHVFVRACITPNNTNSCVIKVKTKFAFCTKGKMLPLLQAKERSFHMIL